MKKRLAIFASGNGSNAEKLMHYFAENPHAEVTLVVSNKPDAGVLKHAENHTVETCVFENADFVSGEKVLANLQQRDIDYIVLAGFLRKIPDTLIAAYAGRIINIHPALLPKFGGKGMYGMHVHTAVKEAGETKTGITIHLVDEEFDNGEHLAQYTCPVTAEDTPATIAAKVQSLEHQYFGPTIEKYITC